MMAGSSLEALGTTTFFSSNILISEIPKQPVFPVLPIQTPSLVKPSILSTPPLQTHSPFRQIFLLTITKSSSASSIAANKTHLSTQPHTRQTPTPGKHSQTLAPSNITFQLLQASLNLYPPTGSESISTELPHLLLNHPNFLNSVPLHTSSTFKILYPSSEKKKTLLVDIVPDCSFDK